MKYFVKITDRSTENGFENEIVMKTGRDCNVADIFSQAFYWAFKEKWTHFEIVVATDAEYKSVIDRVNCESC